MANSVDRATYTLREAQEILGITRFLMYRLVRQGTLPGLRKLSQRRYVVSKAALEAFIASGQRVDHHVVEGA